MSKPVRVVIAEDEAIIRLDLKEILEEEGYETEQASNGEQALRVLSERRPLAITLDLYRTASALAFEIAEIAAGAGVHRRDQHEFAWES